MHYYQFNIADYRKDTVHLTPMEHYIYRTLMDNYYLSEAPIPKETQVVMRRLGLGSDGLESVNNVLSDFFFLLDDGWHHKRIDTEIAHYHEKAEKNRRNGKKGGRPKNQQLTEDKKPKKTQSVTVGNPVETQTKGNQEPITNNQEPITNKDQVHLSVNLKVPIPHDFKLNETNQKWLDDSNLSSYEKTEIIIDFIDYWKLDESKRTLKGWQQSFRKNPIVKRRIVNSKHRGAENGANQQANKTSLAERLQKNRETAEREINEQSVGENGVHVRS